MRRSEKGREITMTLLESIPRRGMEADNFKVTGVAISASVCSFAFGLAGRGSAQLIILCGTC